MSRTTNPNVFFGAIFLLSLFIGFRLLGILYPQPQEGDVTDRVRSSSFRVPKDGPSLAWLMTFPNSGTSYTLDLIATASGTYYATNYGQEQQEVLPNTTSIPVHQELSPHGPFWRYNESDHRLFPQDLVLTKTHCGGRCLGCKPSRYIEASYSFRRRCAEAQQRTVLDDDDPLKLRITRYSESLVEKVVHIMRNPFNNVVARFHHEFVNDRIEEGYDNALEGFRSYCSQVVNPRHEKAENESFVFEAAVLDSVRDIPCYSDFFRYVEWHNQAFWLIEDMGVESLSIYYEDYSTRHKAVLNDLLSFLRLRQSSTPAEFSSGHTYQHYYTDDEKSRLRAAMRRISSRTTWRHLQRYVGDIKDPPNSPLVFGYRRK